MADFATAWAAQRFDFADAVGREVVVQHEAFGLHARQVFDALVVGRGADGDRNEALCFATSEERRTVDARQNANFACNGADLLECTAVDADAFFGNERSHEVIFEVFVGGDDFAFAIGEFRFEVGQDVFFDVAQSCVTLEFCGDRHGGKRFVGIARDGVGDVLRDDGGCKFAFRLADGFGHSALHGEYAFDGIASEIHGIEEFGFGESFRFAFDHDDSFFASDHDDIGIGLFALAIRRVCNPLSIDSGDSDASDGAIPGQIRQHQCGRSACNGDDIGLAVGVVADDRCNDLDFVVEALWEERADGAVDETAREDFVVGLLAFATEVVAGNFARCIRFFDVFTRQWEEILIAAFVGLRARRDDDHRLARLNHPRAIGLLCNVPVFDRYFVCTQERGIFHNCHNNPLFV